MGTQDLSFDGINVARSELARKIALITKFITEETQVDANPNRLHAVRDRVTAILAEYNKTSWNIVDQMTHPNTESTAPDGIWGTISAETPNATTSAKLDESPTLTYSMVLTLHKIGSTQIEVPLLNDEKEAILGTIISLRRVAP